MCIRDSISTMALDDSPWYSSSFALREGLVLKVGDEIFKEEYTSQKDIANATINTIDKKLLALERTIIANNKKSKVNIYEHGQYVAKLTSIVFSELSELHTLDNNELDICLLYTSPSPRDRTRSRMPSSA